ncbi:unnamed protein product [Gongylonema pulchrum]|uniref:Uncharacterized protein n=1 Tax=Gongylonema pulchrum TaxID=637853 RepID=A0A3P6QXX3_9BILA|nr:unnamed protein product [Gongylonema pulchrum]
MKTEGNMFGMSRDKYGAAVAAKETKPRLFTLATLTGHAVLTYGYMAAAMDNGPAHKDRTAEMIQDRGDAYGQPVEISRLHSEVRFYVLQNFGLSVVGNFKICYLLARKNNSFERNVM